MKFIVRIHGGAVGIPPTCYSLAGDIASPAVACLQLCPCQPDTYNSPEADSHFDE
jgi:hypothetical protein